MTPTCQHCGNWRRRNLIFGTCYQDGVKTTAERETCEHYSDKIANRAEFEATTCSERPAATFTEEPSAP